MRGQVLRNSSAFVHECPRSVLCVAGDLEIVVRAIMQERQGLAGQRSEKGNGCSDCVGRVLRIEDGTGVATHPSRSWSDLAVTVGGALLCGGRRTVLLSRPSAVCPRLSLSVSLSGVVSPLVIVRSLTNAHSHTHDRMRIRQMHTRSHLHLCPVYCCLLSLTKDLPRTIHLFFARG